MALKYVLTSNKNILPEYRRNLPKINYNFLVQYLKKNLQMSKKTNKKKLVAPRNIKLSMLYSQGIVYVHQGRINVKVKLTKYKTGLIAGQFAATKKPFCYRPKKKKEKR